MNPKERVSLFGIFPLKGFVRIRTRFIKLIKVPFQKIKSFFCRLFFCEISLNGNIRYFSVIKIKSDVPEIIFIPAEINSISDKAAVLLKYFRIFHHGFNIVTGCSRLKAKRKRSLLL